MGTTEYTEDDSLGDSRFPPAGGSPDPPRGGLESPPAQRLSPSFPGGTAGGMRGCLGDLRGIGVLADERPPHARARRACHARYLHRLWVASRGIPNCLRDFPVTVVAVFTYAIGICWLIGLPARQARGEMTVAQVPESRNADGVPGGGALKLTSPTDGEAWSVDSLHHITWASGPGVKAVTVEHSVDGGRTWAIVANAAGEEETPPPEGAGRLLWAVPDQVSDDCRLRVSDADGPSTRSPSAASFRIVPSQQQEYVWTQVTAEAPFAARDGAGALAFRGRMWLLGGWNPGDRVHFPNICNSEVWSSEDGLSWALEVQQGPWEGRHTAGYAVHGGKMWIVGGDANQKHYQNDVWSSEDGVEWQLVNERVPWGQRVLHHTVVHDGRIWVMGGQTLPQFAPEVQEEIFYNDVWATEDGVDWTRVCEHAPWSPRGMIGGSAVHRGRIWILGGGTYDTPHFGRNYYNDVWSSADGVEWQRHVELAPWAPRQYHDVAAFDERLWVMEGYDGHGNRKDVWYSRDGVNWYEVPDTPWAPRHAASVFVHNGALWMVAGNNMQPDVWKLTRAE
jgi:hypothetical protein